MSNENGMESRRDASIPGNQGRGGTERRMTQGTPISAKSAYVDRDARHSTLRDRQVVAVEVSEPASTARVCFAFVRWPLNQPGAIQDSRRRMKRCDHVELPPIQRHEGRILRSRQRGDRTGTGRRGMQLQGRFRRGNRPDGSSADRALGTTVGIVRRRTVPR